MVEEQISKVCEVKASGQKYVTLDRTKFKKGEYVRVTKVVL